ncbi:MAG: polysulfide reductase NrfD, partial [Saprospiraceae bacterium]|nr:polysulfide reductase NrfD [Saprospiraceae bacterium]
MMDTSIKQISNPDSADRIIEDLSAGPRASYVKWFIYGLVALVIIGLIFYAKQLQQGLGVTAMRDYTTWGIYISNFVFFVAISLVGSLISAVLKLSGAHWQTPLTRISEMIAVSAIILASIVIIIDMGRPDRFLNVIFHARLQSPITWDVIVIATYLV